VNRRSLPALASSLLLLLLIASAAEARPRCPKGTRRATTRERGGLVRTCVKHKKAESDPDVRHGPVRAYYRSGRKRWFGAYKDGVLHGPYQAWKRYGGKRAVGAYKDGKPDGEWTKWFRNSLDRGPYLEGEKHGKWVTELYEGGRIEGAYNLGRHTGPWRTFHANGRLTLERFYDEAGRPVGTWKGYYENGKRRLEGTYVDGRRMGTWQRWYRNGRHEWQRVYPPSGQGQVRRWHPGGKLRLQGQHDAGGDRTGVWQSFYDDGKLRSRTVYERDIVISQRVLDRDGKLLREYPGKHAEYPEKSAKKREGRPAGLPDKPTPVEPQ